MKPRCVGILGGMGPEATVLLMRKVIGAVDAKDDADHVPLLVDQNPQVPSRIARLVEGRGQDPGPVLADMARRLERAGVEALAMPCNTAHHYAEDIRRATTLPLLNMIALAAAHAHGLAGDDGRVGVLASPAVQKIGIFDRAFQAAGLAPPVFAEDQSKLLATVRRVKARGADDIARTSLHALSQSLAARGVNIQIVACTEFSQIADSVAPGVRSFDALDLLAAEIVAFSKGDPPPREGGA